MRIISATESQNPGSWFISLSQNNYDDFYIFPIYYSFYHQKLLHEVFLDYLGAHWFLFLPEPAVRMFNFSGKNDIGLDLG